MISSGIFILPGIAFEKAGPSVFLSYGAAGFAALLGVLSIIELSTAMPKSGGDYFFITRSFGPVLGLIIGFFSWFSLSLKTAFAIFGIAEILFHLTGINLMFIAIATALFFIFLNLRGVGMAIKFEVAIVTVLLAIMVLYIVTGLPSVNVGRFESFAPHGTHAIFLTSGFVFVSFGGLLKVASLSGEVRNPGRSIPIGVIGSILIVTSFYVLLLIVAVGTLNPNQLSTSLTPVADSARLFLGPFGYIIISVAAGLAFISTANAGIMSASRYPVALSHDNLLPGWFAKISRKYETPILAIIITGLLIILSLFLELETLVKIASTIILFSYILTNIAIIIIRESGLQNYHPTFKVPFYPYTQIVSILLFLFLLIEVGLAAIETVVVVVVLSLLLYLFYGRKRYEQEYALLYLIEGIVNKKLSSDSLEHELKEILHDRDELIKDHFHHLIEESLFLDVEKEMTRDQVFKLISEQCCLDLGLTPSELQTLMHERENESSTALTPFLAIPHIIVGGEDHFRMIVVRANKGIYFSEAHPSVKAVFMLAGSVDQRQLHLQTLSAIAQITHHKGFEEKWLTARGIRNLKDLCQLSPRGRIESS